MKCDKCGFQPMTVEEIEEIIKKSWLNTNARASLLTFVNREEINEKQCKELTEALSGIRTLAGKIGKGEEVK